MVTDWTRRAAGLSAALTAQELGSCFGSLTGGMREREGLPRCTRAMGVRELLRVDHRSDERTGGISTLHRSDERAGGISTLHRSDERAGGISTLHRSDERTGG